VVGHSGKRAQLSENSRGEFATSFSPIRIHISKVHAIVELLGKKEKKKRMISALMRENDVNPAFLGIFPIKRPY